jgi:hypothetical protein
MTLSQPVTRNPLGLPWSEVFLVGGGPSLRGFDFKKLKGRTVCAINDAVLHVPWADCLFSADQQWIANREREILKFPGEKFLAGPMPAEDSELFPYYLKRERSAGLSEQPDTLNVRGCSGYAALNLAYLKGAKRIVLLGYDFRNPDAHWYSNYSWMSVTNPSSGRSKMYLGWAQYFNETVNQLKQAGVEVLNASIKSAVTAFPKVTLAEVL